MHHDALNDARASQIGRNGTEEESTNGERIASSRDDHVTHLRFVL
jgi:hypothetical protein